MTFNPFKLRRIVKELTQTLCQKESQITYWQNLAKENAKMVEKERIEVQQMKNADAELRRTNESLVKKIDYLEKKHKGFFGKGKRK